MITDFARKLRFLPALLFLAYTNCGDGKTGPNFAATMVANSATEVSGAPGAPVSPPPSVVVLDQDGNPVAGATVTFAVESGGGSVTGATPTSNESGIATVGSWTLGAAPATNTLVATTEGVSSVTFRAIASSSKCLARTPHTLGSTIGGTLETDDCKYPDNSFVDFFSTTVTEATAYLFRQSASFDTYLDLALADGSIVAENDDESDANPNSAIKALLPAGTYVLGASSFDPAITGNYTVSSQVTSADNASCELYFVVKNVSTTQNIAASDCLWTQAPTSPTYADAFYILLRAGQSLTINMSSSAVDSYLELVRINASPVVQNDNRDGSTKDARITFTATVTDYYAIVARTAVASQTGAYTLTIQ